MSDIYGATGLIGGTTGALDAIDGAGLADKDIAFVTLQDGEMYPYVLKATSGETENSPYIISPDTNAGTKRWKLVGLRGVMSRVLATTDAEQSIPDATNAVLIFEDEVYDSLSEYNTTTGVFTATYAGDYMVAAGAYFQNVAWADGEAAVFYILKNGAPYARNARVTAYSTIAATMGANISMVVPLAANDTISIRVWHNRGSATTIISQSEYNYLNIHRLVG